MLCAGKNDAGFNLKGKRKQAGRERMKRRRRAGEDTECDGGREWDARGQEGPLLFILKPEKTFRLYPQIRT